MALNHGGEQGLEPGTMQLPQDYAAAKEAINGWWKDSQISLHDRMGWFCEAKFGCFIHWGPYSALESRWDGTAYDGYAEHIMRMAAIPLAEYKEKVVKNFNPFLFDAEEWILQAKKAGMRYFIITAKHHDGFAMWHSDTYDYDMRMTKFNQRDPIMELCNAAKKHGIKFGPYYSHAFDWEHPHAPGNDWDDFSAITGFPRSNPGGDKLHGGREWWQDNTYHQFLQHAEKYVEEKAKPQIAELVRKLDPDIMWFDTPHKLPLYLNIEICKFLRELKPEIVINGRLARWENYQLGDYENSGDRAAYFFPLADEYWETIPTTNNSFGYSSVDNSHKPPVHFIRLLACAVSKGGNILLNVGPMGNGKWDTRDADIFNAVGAWLEKNGESIYGTVRTNDIPVPNWGVITKKNDTLFLHVHQWPQDGVLWLGSLKADIRRAALFATGETLAWSQEGSDIRITLPAACPDTDSTVIALTLNGGYTSYPHRLLDPRVKNVLQVFDADLTGNFTRGDGKVARNFLSGWVSNDMSISWNLSLREKYSFSLALEYCSSGNAGTVSIEINGAEHDLDYRPGDTSSVVDRITLDAGNHIVRLKGKTLNGEHISPMTLTFIPYRI
ncbi:MAG: alpha-L-fucosidase [Treponema sp.]|nr:alpha-L-fucosidase [Treponema sp.]